MQTKEPDSYLLIPRILEWLSLLLLLMSMVFTLRFITTVSIGFLLLLQFVQIKKGYTPKYHQKNNWLILSGAILLFIATIATVIISDDRNGWSTVRIQSGLLFIPLVLILTKIDYSQRLKLMQAFCIMLAAASLVCIVYATYQFRFTGNTQVFYYHTLATPINQHAVYFSILLFIGTVFLVESAIRHQTVLSRHADLPVTVLLCLMIFLLSSKLVIIVCGIYIVSAIAGLFKLFNSKLLALAPAIIILILVFILAGFRNPVHQRFSEISGSKLGMISQEKFDPADYFNGLQFRMLQWRITARILQEKKSWLNGVGISKTSAERNKQYKELNIYLGDPATGTVGYQIYNSHNQLLETMLQTGIPGLIGLLIFCLGIVKTILATRNKLIIFPLLLLLLWMLTESVFETQFGVLFLSFFPLFLSGMDINNKFSQSSPTPLSNTDGSKYQSKL